MIYCLIGDITSHGSNVIPGAFLSCVEFLNVVKHHSDINIKTFSILDRIGQMLNILDDDDGGTGLAICLRINTETNDLHYSGFIFSKCMTLNGEVQPLTASIRLGEEAHYNVTRENHIKLAIGDVIEIVTDGWVGDEDDKAKLILRIKG
jgi:hypothetical protein